MDAEYILSVAALVNTTEQSISSDIGEVETNLSPEDKKQKIEEVKKKLAPLRQTRGVVKRKVTLLFKNLLEIIKEDKSSSLISSILDEVSLRLGEVRQHDEEIEALLCASNILQIDHTLLDEEVLGSTHYHIQQQKIFNKVRPSVAVTEHKSSASCSHEDTELPIEMHSTLRNFNSKQEIKIPPLKCKTFSGDSDRHQFRSFHLSFENVIGCRRDLTDATKLQYLKSHLSSYALRDIEHLPNIDANYAVALQILRDLYLDVPYIIDSLLHRIYTAPVLENRNLETVRAFISEVRAFLHELKEFDLDFLEEGSAGCKLISHIVADKLPSNFLRELKLDTKDEYPSINVIIDKYHVILKSLEKIRGRKNYTPSNPISNKKSNASGKKTQSSFHSTSQSFKQEHASPQQNIGQKPEATSVKCKLCEGAHFMTSCTTYSNSVNRRARCVELGLCANCSSAKHVSLQCPAKKYGLSRPCILCKSKLHISALCSSNTKAKGKSNRHHATNESSTSSSSPQGTVEEETTRNNLCINTGSSSSGNILPTMSLKVKKGDKMVTVRALLDFGSQRSYFRGSFLEKLGVSLDSLPQCSSTIKTFLGEQTRIMNPIDLEINVCCDSFVEVPVLVDPDLDVGFEVKGLMGAEFNIRHNGYRIADSFYHRCRHSDHVKNIECLLGIDVLYLLKHFKVVNCLKGSAIDTCHGQIPFGPVKSFLTPSQIETIFHQDNSRLQSETSS